MIRVVGPSFEIVSGWAAQGIPLKVAFSGIDRYFERYYRKGPRRRPIKIDFCEADVLDAFDEWRRALGLVGADAAVATDERPSGSASSSLPAHLERVITRLTTARAMGKIDAAFDVLLDRIARESWIRPERRRAFRRGARGLACGWRRTTAAQTARAGLDDESRAALSVDADSELVAYRDRMAPEAFARARDTAVDRLLRERFGLPVVTF